MERPRASGSRWAAGGRSARVRRRRSFDRSGVHPCLGARLGDGGVQRCVRLEQRARAVRDAERGVAVCGNVDDELTGVREISVVMVVVVVVRDLVIVRMDRSGRCGRGAVAGRYGERLGVDNRVMVMVVTVGGGRVMVMVVVCVGVTMCVARGAREMVLGVARLDEQDRAVERVRVIVVMEREVDVGQHLDAEQPQHRGA